MAARPPAGRPRRARLPSFAETLAELRRQADAVTVAHPEPGEPTAESIDAQGEVLRESGAQVIVAVGGGSVMDT
jgi:Alcohol dehydrogenase, class IV